MFDFLATWFSISGIVAGKWLQYVYVLQWTFIENVIEQFDFINKFLK